MKSTESTDLKEKATMQFTEINYQGSLKGTDYNPTAARLAAPAMVETEDLLMRVKNTIFRRTMQRGQN